jgi:hypothetical protein
MFFLCMVYNLHCNKYGVGRLPMPVSFGIAWSHCCSASDQVGRSALVHRTKAICDQDSLHKEGSLDLSVHLKELHHVEGVQLQ